MSEHPLDQAIAAVDRALEHRPTVDGHAFTEATKAVSAYRDQVRFALRDGTGAPGDQSRLADSNLAITLLMAGHFPLGEAPWDKIEHLREQLRRMRADAG